MDEYSNGVRIETGGVTSWWEAPHAAAAVTLAAVVVLVVLRQTFRHNLGG